MNWLSILKEVLAASLGTVFFSVLFQIRPKHFLSCGLTGGLGWLIYCLALARTGSPALATFVATIALSIFSRWLSFWRLTPALVFLVSGIFPLVPGGAVCYAACHLFLGQYQAAASYTLATLKLAAAIALGILVAYALPTALFCCRKRKIQLDDVAN